MASRPSYALSQEQIDHFMRHGFVRVTDCFSQEKAKKLAGDVWERLGVSPTDKSTWTTEITHMDETKTELVRTFAPKAWAAICHLLGGEGRTAPESRTWNDAFIVNLGSPESEGTWPKPADLEGWHVDGDFFTHFLDSPEQALLVIPLFTDIEERAGGTMICSDATKVIAQHLVGQHIYFPFAFVSDLSPVRSPRGRFTIHASSWPGGRWKPHGYILLLRYHQRLQRVSRDDRQGWRCDSASPSDVPLDCDK